MLNIIQRINQSIQNVEFTVQGGAAIAFILFIVIGLIAFILSFINLNIQWFSNTLPKEKTVELVLSYIFVLILVIIIKSTTIIRK